MWPRSVQPRCRPRRDGQLVAALATEVVLDEGFAIGSWPRAAAGRGACVRGVARAVMLAAELATEVVANNGKALRPADAAPSVSKVDALASMRATMHAATLVTLGAWTSNDARLGGARSLAQARGA